MKKNSFYALKYISSAILILLCIAACGQRGSLYLPSPNSVGTQKTNPTTSPPSKTQENTAHPLKPEPNKDKETPSYINPISQPIQP
jgi:predicted small lipoprotein YifL